MLLKTFPFVLFALVNSLDLNPASPESVEAAASRVAVSIISNYTALNGQSGFGVFDDDIYWFEAGAVWGGFVDYWSYTGDAQYNDLVAQALLFQVGENNDYMPANQTTSLGNDDQAIWALSALLAAERNFPFPSNKGFSWQDLAITVFNLQVARWDRDTCDGGLRWQIFTFNNGYNTKNSASQSTFFLLAARLARYTGNQTYTDWARKAYEWTESIGLIGNEGQVYDSTNVDNDCSEVNKIQWSYNNAAFLYGSAIMTDLAQNNASNPWTDRTAKLLKSMLLFFNESEILSEVACESANTCMQDMYIFKALSAQWLGQTTQIPSLNSTTDVLSKYLSASAEGAAKQCTGTSGSQTDICGASWTASEYDGNMGLAQQLSALNIIIANLARNSSANSTIPANTTAAGQAHSPSGTAASSPSSSSFAAAMQNPVSNTMTWTLVLAAMVLWQ